MRTEEEAVGEDSVASSPWVGRESSSLEPHFARSQRDEKEVARQASRDGAGGAEAKGAPVWTSVVEVEREKRRPLQIDFRSRRDMICWRVGEARGRKGPEDAVFLTLIILYHLPQC